MAYDPINQVFETLTDLSKQKGIQSTSVMVLGSNTVNDGNGGVYLWDDTSTAVADGVRVVQVTGVTTGRWLRSRNNNYGTGTTTFSGILQTVYTVNHNQNFTPGQIHIQARNQGAASGTSYVTNITATTFQIVFNALPVVGTNNITFDFLAIRGN